MRVSIILTMGAINTIALHLHHWHMQRKKMEAISTSERLHSLNTTTAARMYYVALKLVLKSSNPSRIQWSPTWLHLDVSHGRAPKNCEGKEGAQPCTRGKNQKPCILLKVLLNTTMHPAEVRWLWRESPAPEVSHLQPDSGQSWKDRCPTLVSPEAGLLHTLSLLTYIGIPWNW